MENTKLVTAVEMEMEEVWASLGCSAARAEFCLAFGPVVMWEWKVEAVTAEATDYLEGMEDIPRPSKMSYGQKSKEVDWVMVIAIGASALKIDCFPFRRLSLQRSVVLSSRQLKQRNTMTVGLQSSMRESQQRLTDRQMKNVD